MSTHAAQAPRSPVDRVLETTELLEHILSLLPVKDILVSKRVSTTFRDTFDGSVNLRRKVYPPAPVNTLVKNILGTYPRDVIASKMRLGQPIQRRSSIVPSGLFFDELIFDSLPGTSMRARLRCTVDFATLDPEASCLPMYITDPPVHFIEITSRAPFASLDSYQSIVSSANGITVDDIRYHTIETGITHIYEIAILATVWPPAGLTLARRPTESAQTAPWSGSSAFMFPEITRHLDLKSLTAMAATSYETYELFQNSIPMWGRFLVSDPVMDE